MLAIAAVGLCLGACRTEAQTYGTLSIGTVPATLATAAATNSGTVIDVRGNRNVGIYFQGAGDANSTATATAHFLGSLDGSNFSTKQGYDIILTLANTATAACTTNYDLGAIGYLKLQYVTNAAGVNITNAIVQVSLKPGS